MLRNRTLTGCGTCRSRHLKCDETRPICQTCQRLRLVCQGYEPRFQWLDKDAQSTSPRDEDTEGKTFRRPLFTTVEQETMTRMTVSSLRKQTASSALTKLENGHPNNARDAFEAFRGPFGVMRFPEPVTVPEEAPLPELESFENECEMPWGGPDEATLSLLNDVTSTDFNDFLDPFLDTATFGPSMAEPVSPLPTLLAPMPLLDPLSADTIPQQAPFLLRHFRENIISLSFPLRNCRKCPWQTIHLPSAMGTFAELSIYKTASHTKLSLFYSLLSASCFHLSTQNQDSYDWDKMGSTYQELAKQKLKCALREEVVGPKKAKYKELLMALLSLVMLAILTGKHADAQALLMDAECLIRMRGLPKPRKSVKLRSLHHVYTYIRIMAESTCGYALLRNSPAPPSSNPLSTQPSYLTPRSFRVADHTNDDDLNMQLEKGFDVGYNDIHLEVMGQWKETLYPDLYGIPEPLMALLSQTIRLANEQELLHQGTTMDACISVNLQRRAKMLEKLIISWKTPTRTSVSLEHKLASDSEQGNYRAAHYMMLAVHQALILFYYRRITKIHASMLQGTVRKTLEYLIQSDEADRGSGTSSAIIPWPGFVAACEALEPGLQGELLEWLLTTGQKTALRSFATAAETAQRVWRAREDTGDYTLSWLEVMTSDQWSIIAN